MTRPRRASDPPVTATTSRRRPLRLLLVETGHDVDAAVAQAARLHSFDVVRAGGVAEARQLSQDKPIDIVLADSELHDGCGIELAADLRRTLSTRPQTLVMTAKQSFSTALKAIRFGIRDLLVKPMNHDELGHRLGEAAARARSAGKRRRRYKRLRRACRDLDVTRKEVGQQVDVLCEDLVVAYQELAQQMQQVVYASEFGAIIRQELDLEQLLRCVLEFVVEKAGPTNAAVFLPANAHEYTLGGYVNYDTISGSPDLLLEHLADVAVPAIADHDGVLLLDDNAGLHQWLGDDAAHLEDCHVLASTGRHDDEVLAVLMLFRDGEDPFAAQALEAMETITPMLADHLARIIRVHHRHLPDDDSELYGGESGGLAA